MKRRLLWLCLVISVVTISCKDDDETNPIELSTELKYEVNLNDQSNDRFKVRVNLPPLTDDNAIFQFPVTAPGTYQVFDVGRFVRSFRAYDADGKLLGVERISTNQWKLSDPASTRRIEYNVKETWDTLVNVNPIFKMAGTSLEQDHVFFNAFCVLGYPTAMDDQKIQVRFDTPGGWKAGTVLNKNSNGYYEASDYDHLVDSPILFGNITEAQKDIEGSKISVYTYSKGGKVNSTTVMNDISTVLDAASQFLKGLPVQNYAFLFHYGEFDEGALEHSYSSEYVLKDYYPGVVKSITAHEFFHIVTPLNIHSEIIEDFNFVTPTPSQHLWLYEGVTEWASDMMLFRAGKMQPEDYYFFGLAQKIYVDSKFDPDFSLVEMSLQSYTDKGQDEYYNIYNRGAIVAGLLDIRLLELSGGTKGLREIILELMNTYGPSQPFNDDLFFDVLVQKTYPEIEDFINKYIKDSQPLPLYEYYNKIGLEYIENPGTYPEIIPVASPSVQQLALYTAWSKNL